MRGGAAASDKPRAMDDSGPAGGPALCIVLPVLNEASNITPLLERIDTALRPLGYVVCIIDDGSRDETVALAIATAERLAMRLHMIRRVKAHAGSQRGSALLAGVLWGLENTTAGVFAEMDGDLSHRPEELPLGFGLVAEGRVDVAIASKYVRGSAVDKRAVGRRRVSR